jgi:tetratricopeptide (TPR) repeat protein
MILRKLAGLPLCRPKQLHCRPIALAVVCSVALGCGHNAGWYVDTGAKHYAKGRYAEADINYRKAIQKDGNRGDAYYGLARTLLKEEKPREALAALQKAVDLAPGNIDAKRLLTDLLLAGYLNDQRRPKVLYDKLHTLATQFLSKDPNSYDGLRISGYLAVTDRNTVEALTYFRRANAVKPMEPDIVVALAQVLLQDETTAPQGERLLLDFTGKRPAISPPYDLLYRRYMATNRQPEAETLLKTKVANNPGQAPFVEQLAEHYRRTGQAALMTATLSGMTGNPRAFPRAHLQVGDYYNQTGNRQEALAEYERGAKAGGPDEVVYRRRLVGTLAAQGRAQEALAAAEQTLHQYPHDPDLRTERALLLLRQKQFDPAVKALRELIAENNGNPELHFHLGRALILQGDMTAGRTELREAVRLRDTYLEARIALASLALDNRQFAEAQTELDRVLALAPDNPPALLLRAAALQGLGKYGEARAVLVGLQTRFPNSPGLDVEMAFLDLHENKFVEAERVFRKRYQPGQESLRPLLGLCQTLFAQKRTSEALALLLEELAKAPNRPQVQLMVSEAQLATGDSGKALQTLQQLVAAQPQLAIARLRLGALQLQAGDLDHSIATLQKASELAPNSIEPLPLLAHALMQAQRPEEAKKYYRLLLARDAGNLQALNDLAFITADLGGNLDEALKLATDALHRAPEQPNVKDTVGYVYLKMRKPQTALQVFRNLAEHYPANATFRYHYGLALIETGDKAGAKKQLQAALAGKPSPTLAPKIKQALERTT